MREELDKWIKEAEEYGDKEWKPCITALNNWKEEILNTFICKWIN
ncbi:MAG: transposase [Tissierellia bacterium]|nr:transposase [Tissierellia bacterium]